MSKWTKYHFPFPHFLRFIGPQVERSGSIPRLCSTFANFIWLFEKVRECFELFLNVLHLLSWLCTRTNVDIGLIYSTRVTHFSLRSVPSVYISESERKRSPCCSPSLSAVASFSPCPLRCHRSLWGWLGVGSKVWLMGLSCNVCSFFINHLWRSRHLKILVLPLAHLWKYGLLRPRKPWWRSTTSRSIMARGSFLLIVSALLRMKGSWSLLGVL